MGDSYFLDGLGEKVYVNDETGVRAKRIHFNPVMNFEKQWCPNCHRECVLAEDNYVFECRGCRYSVDMEMIANGEGYGSYEDSMRFDGLE